MKSQIVIEKARMEHVQQLHRLLNYFADRREVLPRSLSEIYENLQQFFVALKGNEVVGCCALYITWAGLAEVKALAVAPEYQGRGLGTKLLKTAIGEAKKLGVEVLFTLTIREKLFQKFGFKPAKKSDLPHKVWTECVRCPYFPSNCIETSLILVLKKKKGKKTHNLLTDMFMSTSQPLIPNEPQKAYLSPPPVDR